jgi:hypothetical protein
MKKPLSDTAPSFRPQFLYPVYPLLSLTLSGGMIFVGVSGFTAVNHQFY